MANPTMAITIKARDLATKGIKSAGNAVKGMTRNLFSLKGAMAVLAGGFGAFKFSQEFIEANSTLEQMKFRMDALLGSAERGEKAFEFIRKFQRENPIGSIKEMTSAFEGLVVAGIDPASGALEALITGSRKFGLTEDAVKGVTVALRQMSAKGNLQAEELNQLAERLPGIYKKLANELGFGDNVKKFQDDMKKRLIGGQEASLAVIRVLAKEGEGIAEEYANTWQAKITQLKSLWFDIMTEIGQVGAFQKVKDTLSNIIKLLNKNKGVIVAYFSTLADGFLGAANMAIEFLNKVDFAGIGKSFLKTFNETFAMIKKTALSIGILAVEAVNMFTSIENKVIDVRRTMYNLGIINPFKEDMERLSKLRDELDAFRGLADIALDKRKSLLSGDDVTDDDKRRASIQYQIYQNNIRSRNELLEEEKALQKKIEKQRKLYTDGLNNIQEVSSEGMRARLSAVDADTKAYNNKIDQIVDGTFIKIQKLKNQMSFNLEDVGDAGTEGLDLLGVNKQEVKKSQTDLFVEGWTEALEKAKEKYDWFMSDFAQTGKFMAETVTGALSSQFDDFFSDLIDGKMKSFKDSILGFLKDIARAMSQAFSQKLSAQIISGIGGSIFGSMYAGKAPTTSNGAVPLPLNSGVPTANSGMLSKAQSVEIINNTNEPVQASKATVRQDVSGQIMSIVLDSVRTNKGGSRQALKASLM